MYVYNFLFLGDLWGPLLICLLLSCILSLTAPGDSASLVFAAVFVIVWYVRSRNIYKENFMKALAYIIIVIIFQFSCFIYS